MRSYTVGLPVSIDVHEDGSVTIEVHLEEADDLFDGVPIDDAGRGLYADPQIEEDQRTVLAAVRSINHTFTTTINPL
jgi:hypothetical protein